jgi:acetyl-CoA C-acetyltransferase
MNSPAYEEVFIISAARTAIGRMQGTLATRSADQLGAAVIRASVRRAGLPELADIDEVFMGNVVSAGLGQNIARQCAVHGGLPSCFSCF